MVTASGWAFSQFTFNKGQVAEKQYYAEIPFTYEDHLIKIVVNYKGQNLPFLLDTGAGNLLFSDQVKSKQTISATDVFDDASQLETIDHQNFKIGNVDFRDMNFVVMDKPSVLKKCFGVNGLIGSNSFRNSILKIDYANKKVIVTNDVTKLGLSNYNAYDLNPYSATEILPTFDINYQLGDDKFGITFLFDTGFNRYITLASGDLDILQNADEVTKTREGKGIDAFSIFGADRKKDLKAVYLKHDFVFGDLSTGLQEINVDSPSMSSVGNILLETKAPIIDYIHQKVYFQRGTTKLTIPDEEPVKILFHKGALSIVGLWDDYVNKAKIGDKVLEINGQKVNATNICETISEDFMKQYRPIKTLKLEGQNGIYELSIP